MMRIVPGVLVGLLVWGLLLVTSDFAWASISPEWFGKHQHELRSAIFYDTPFAPQAAILIIVVLRSLVYSIFAGVATAIIACENDVSTFWLGIALVVFGTLVHLTFWNLVPVWYHLAILFSFVPLTMLGGKLITPIPRRQKLVS